MKTIKFHYYSSAGIGAFLIRARLASIFNHVAIEFEDTTIHSTLLHGCEEINPGDYAEPRYTVEIEVTNKNYKKAFAYAKSRVGLKYDYKAIIGFIVIKKLQTDNGDFCSELGLEIFKRAVGINITMFTLTTPGQLRLITDVYQIKK